MKVENNLYWENRKISDSRRDWLDKGENWIEDYLISSKHCHRDKILKALSKIKFKSLAEIGCNAGANLLRIRDKFKNMNPYLIGYDINKDAIKMAKKSVLGVNFKELNVLKGLPLDKIDVILSDAVLLYVSPENIKFVLNEFDRVANKAIVLCEWDSDKKEGELKDNHWSYNYKSLLEDKGFEVKKIKITKWPTNSGNWERNGYIFVAVRQSPISMKS